jgi:two-component system response regulator
MMEPLTILLVEDNEDDTVLTRRAFAKAHIANPLVCVTDGVRALEYLFGPSTSVNEDRRALPLVVLADINLPRVTGTELLQAIRATPSTLELPFVLLTSSDREEGQFVGCSHLVYLVLPKPLIIAQLIEVTRDVGLDWVAHHQSLVAQLTDARVVH